MVIEIKNYDKWKNENFKEKKIIYFDVIKDYNIKLEINSDLCFFKNNEYISMPFEKFISILKDEIKYLGELYDLNHSIKKYHELINKADNSDKFFYIIVKMYTMEGYLYKILNQFLRIKQSIHFDKIIFYYTSLLASFEYLKNLNPPNEIVLDNDLIVHRASKVSED